MAQCSFLEYFFSPPSFLPPSSYILWILYLFPRPRVDWAFFLLFLHPSCFFLNLPSLAGRLHVYCSGITSLRYLLFLTIILYLIFSPSLCCKVCPRRCSKRLISSPDTSDRSSEVTIVLGHGQIPHKHAPPLLGG